jgi:hypothetical protein
MHFLVVDSRFSTPIYVILESDPRGEPAFPDLPVREITLECRAGRTEKGMFGARHFGAVGRDPSHLGSFREFGSDMAVAGAGFILIEPRYIGPSWPSYISAFRPEGDKPDFRSRPASRRPSV